MNPSDDGDAFSKALADPAAPPRHPAPGRRPHVGKVFHPQTMRGQCRGALARGVGDPSYEEVIPKDRRILNLSFRACRTCP